jgi:hypothetical protein
VKVGVLAVVILVGVCSAPVPMTATVDATASHTALVGGAEQLVVKVVNTGPVIPHLGLVFRSPDHWYERHKMTDLGGCVIAADESAFDCGDLQKSETKTYSFFGTATSPGSFHYELALRELVQPFDFVNDHPDGADAVTWDETVTAQ